MVPVDTRLRCCEVSRAWQALLADTSFWTSLKMSLDSGVARFSLALVRAAVAKAGGQLRCLDITGQPFNADEDEDDVTLEVATVNAGTLTELHVERHMYWGVEDVQALLDAAPALSLLEISVIFENRAEDYLLAPAWRENRFPARAMLRNEPPFQALRLQKLAMDYRLVDPADVVTFSSDMQRHTSIKELSFCNSWLDTAAAMSAFVDACIALRLRKVQLGRCHFEPAALPELTRALRELHVSAEPAMFHEAHESTRLFVAAIRASSLTRLEIEDVRHCVPPSVLEAAALINARRQ